MRHWVSALCAALMVVACQSAGVASAPAASPPPPVWAAPAPTTESQIWGDPALPGTPEAEQLAAAGYVREEFFLSGGANVYAYGADGRVAVERAGVPFTTRVIVIRPSDPARFSGVVQLNPFHPLQGRGNSANMRPYVLAHGDAYVGVLIGDDANTRTMAPQTPPIRATEVLRWFDPVRYAPINWPDDDGIRWDVFAQTAMQVRDRASGLMAGFDVQRVYASGWSFTGSFLRTYINEGFHERYRRINGAPLIDGYLIGISSFSFRSGYVPINGHTENLPVEDARRRNRPIDVPVIELMSENEAITNRDPVTPDADSGVGMHRLYEAPGLTHGSGQGGGARDVMAQQIAARMPRPGALGVTDPCTAAVTDVDMGAFGRAALANLHLWATTGAAPARVARMQVDQTTWLGVKDAQGNTLGGLRAAQLEVPLARYGDPPPESGCRPRVSSIGSPSIEMRRTPLTRAQLARLYPGGRAEYLRRFDAAVDALVARRLLLEADGAAQKAQARANADAAFTR